MKKRILGVVIALVLCLGLLPTTALADGGPWGLLKGDTVSRQYDSLEEILENISASGGDYTIKLLDNYTETSSGSPYQINYTCTLDLNGHALTLAKGFQLVNGGTLTLTDSSADAKGSFTVTGGQPCFTVDDSGSELNINSGICQSDAAVITANAGTVRVTGGTLAGGRGAGSAARAPSTATATPTSPSAAAPSSPTIATPASPSTVAASQYRTTPPSRAVAASTSSIL